MVSSNARTKEASQAKYISILNIIQGEVDPTQVIIVMFILNVFKLHFGLLECLFKAELKFRILYYRLS